MIQSSVRFIEARDETTLDPEDRAYAFASGSQPAEAAQHQSDEGNDPGDRQGCSRWRLDRDQPIGVLSIPDQPRQVPAQLVKDRSQQIGVPPQHEPEDRESEGDGGKDREEGKIADTRGQDIAPGTGVAPPRPPWPARPPPRSDRLHGIRPESFFTSAPKSKVRTARETRSSPCSNRSKARTLNEHS